MRKREKEPENKSFIFGIVGNSKFKVFKHPFFWGGRIGKWVPEIVRKSLEEMMIWVEVYVMNGKEKWGMVKWGLGTCRFN